MMRREALVGKMVPAADLHPPGPAGVYEDDNNA